MRRKRLVVNFIDKGPFIFSLLRIYVAAKKIFLTTLKNSSEKKRSRFSTVDYGTCRGSSRVLSESVCELSKRVYAFFRRNEGCRKSSRPQK